MNPYRIAERRKVKAQDHPHDPDAMTVSHRLRIVKIAWPVLDGGSEFNTATFTGSKVY